MAAIATAAARGGDYGRTIRLDIDGAAREGIVLGQEHANCRLGIVHGRKTNPG